MNGQDHGTSASMSVSLDSRGLLIDDRPVPLVAGSIEYWRVISLYWRTCLLAMRGAGLELLSSFVCWDFHEVEYGNFDFVGDTHPSRDLAGFLDACEDEGFKVLLRVGPIIDAEWPTRGPARDVCQLQRTDPRYRERTEKYLDALLEHIRPRLASAGGPIIMVALDNEVYYPYATDDEADPSEGSIPVPYAKDEVLATYSDWLSRRYADDHSLRDAWGDEGASLASPTEPDYENGTPRSVLDSFEFLTDQVAETYTWMRDFCRSRGVDVPLYSNMKPLSQYIGWQQIERDIVDGHGIGLFLSNMVPGEQALVASWYVRLQRALTQFPWAAELQSLAPMGQEKVFGVLSDEHQRYVTELTLAAGLRGISYYVFVERDDAYGAPISPLGKIRPRLEQVSKAIAMAKGLEADRQLANVGLLWSYDHHRLAIADRIDRWENLHHVWIGMDSPQELPEWWTVFRDLHTADVDFAIEPMASSDLTEPVLIYAGPEVVRASELERVVAAVEGGSTLLSAKLPTRSLDGDDEVVAALSERLRQSGRWVGLSRRPLVEVLAELGASSIISAATPGVWTTAYESDSACYFFAVNTTQAPATVALEVAEDVVREIQGSTATDLTSGESVPVEGRVLGGGAVELGPKSVRAFKAEKRAMRRIDSNDDERMNLATGG